MTIKKPPLRYESLDVVRGFGVLGILMVNALGFAMPLAVAHNPLTSPIELTQYDLNTWWVIETFFTTKFYTIFALLFGVSLYLVGKAGFKDDVTHRVSSAFQTPLFRRLSVLIVIGFIHGAFIWDGDILLMYGLTGLLFWRWQHASGRKLLLGGCVFFLISSGLVVFANSFETPPQDIDLKLDILSFHGSFEQSLRANFSQWSKIIWPTLNVYLPKTLALMMVGLGLFKVGFLKGESSLRAYLAFIILGMISLGLIGYQNYDSVINNFAYPDFYKANKINNEFLSLLVSIAYISILILFMKSPLGRVLLFPLKQTGRMAFSNYLMQSLIMTALFWGGRAPLQYHQPWYGSMSYSSLLPIVFSLWIAQMIFSMIWLSVFAYGPFEWLWRYATHLKAPIIWRKNKAIL